MLQSCGRSTRCYCQLESAQPGSAALAYAPVGVGDVSPRRGTGERELATPAPPPEAVFVGRRATVAQALRFVGSLIAFDQRMSAPRWARRAVSIAPSPSARTRATAETGAIAWPPRSESLEASGSRT